MGSPFSIDLGVSQGRIPSTSAPDGSYVYEFGHTQRIDERVAAGDYHEVQQTVTLSPQAALLRATVKITPPDTITTGYAWLFTMRLNGVIRASRTIEAGRRAVTLTDLTIPLALANIAPLTNLIAFRLELIT